jgi:hypothetical protein
VVREKKIMVAQQPSDDKGQSTVRFIGTLVGFYDSNSIDKLAVPQFNLSAEGVTEDYIKVLP